MMRVLVVIAIPLLLSLARKEAAYRTERKFLPGPPFIATYLWQGSKLISYWHEVPLFAEDNNLHYICEIPKETTAKMEVAKTREATPIQQDVTKDGQLRFYPYTLHWNYGLFPQTWEDPKHRHSELEVRGDNDPLDVVVIGSDTHCQGGVYKVKPLCAFAMIDDGELDWKVVVISLTDPKALHVNNVADVEEHFPSELDGMRNWFKHYKEDAGGSLVEFGFDGECLDREHAWGVIQETHLLYNPLKSGARRNDGNLSLI